MGLFDNSKPSQYALGNKQAVTGFTAMPGQGTSLYTPTGTGAGFQASVGQGDDLAAPTGSSGLQAPKAGVVTGTTEASAGPSDMQKAMAAQMLQGAFKTSAQPVQMPQSQLMQIRQAQQGGWFTPGKS
jgi:hypothetical protein